MAPRILNFGASWSVRVARGRVYAAFCVERLMGRQSVNINYAANIQVIQEETDTIPA